MYGKRVNEDFSSVQRGLTDADTLDGFDSSYFATNTLSNVTNTNVMNKVLAVDGVSSGLDADLLDGQHGSYYLNFNNLTNKPTECDGGDF